MLAKMNSIERTLTMLLKTPCRVVTARMLGGGCISEAMEVGVEFADRLSVPGEDLISRWPQGRLFVKRNEPAFLDNFECEAWGLEQLAQAGAIRAPRPVAVGVAEGRAWLVTTWIETGPTSQDFFPKFGQQLARLHQVTLGTEIGGPRDNYLGAARQVNSPRATWSEFVAEQRIGFQLQWAIDQHLAGGKLVRDVEKIIHRMGALLQGRAEQTSLLHGDLWSGNYLCDSQGEPVIVDPAVYRGCREAELGMIRLFGGCPPAFDRAYQDTFPLPAGWQRRVSVYVLYHLLNHLNLFGRGYLGQCQRLAADLLQE